MYNTANYSIIWKVIMIEILEKNDTLKTVKLEKDTWVLELPVEVCEREGFAEGTLVSLTIKNSSIEARFVRPPSKKLQDISAKLLEKNKKLYEELKRLGD